VSKIRGDDKREFDTTQLHESGHGNYVHRDYLAHCLRWGFIGRGVTHQDEILEVGCGQDTPLVKVMTLPGLYPKRYVGVDLNKAGKRASTRGWATFHWEFNFIKDHKRLGGKFTRAVCFEVIEHMQKTSGQKLLKGIYDQLAPKGRLFLSTPVFNGKAQARNHIHEFTIPELRACIKKAGFTIIERYGTFMSAPSRVVRSTMNAEHLRTYDAVAEYYGGEVAACFIAPMYPDLARNNVWICEK
jgi:SAM-dependent methyltransferase